MERKEQFGQCLGGSESLPPKVCEMKRLLACVAEIAEITNTIGNPKKKLIFQKLPIHMRRRAMTHNAKRLPKKLQEPYIKQMAKSGLSSKKKRPRKKYRKRPSNLSNAFKRRQRKHKWLETHIWHAKRFHMIDKWGYCLAYHSNKNCFRYNYHTLKDDCLMQDISYYACIEITGPGDILISTLRTHCDLSRQTFAAEDCVNGKREGTLMFFKKNSFPHSPIGNVSFFWRPAQTKVRTIWIWLHPATYNEILEELIESFNFVPLNEETCSTNIIHKENMNYINDNNCKMKSLKDLLNRFRLYGRSAPQVITNALSIYNPNEESTKGYVLKMEAEDYKSTEEAEKTVQNDIELSIANDLKSTEPWHMKYYNNEENLKLLIQQNEFWKHLSILNTPNNLPPYMVCAFTVADPRFRISDKLKRSKDSNEPYKMFGLPPLYACYSPIWDENIRDEVTKSKLTTKKLSKLSRSQCLVTGVQNDKYFNPNIVTKIPILVIQNPGLSGSGFTSCLDIILPADWAMSFWLSLIFNNAREGALRESEFVILESSIVKTLNYFDPDTSAYEKESQEEKSKLTTKYFQRPPNNRSNFTKFGISSPFFCEWKILVKEWSNKENFCVLREHNLLRRLEKKFNPKSKICQDLTLNEDTINLLQNSSYLIRIKLKSCSKGRPTKFSIICMPTEEDLNEIEKNKSWPGPLAELRKDPNEKLRGVMRKNHALHLKRLRAQKKRSKRKLSNKVVEAIKKTIDLTMQEKEEKMHKKLQEAEGGEYTEKIKELWLPKCSSVRYSCDREVMGYVTEGGISYFQAIGVGIGYITIQSFLQLSSNVVLIRNPTTRQYRTAKLELIGIFP